MKISRNAPRSGNIEDRRPTRGNNNGRVNRPKLESYYKEMAKMAYPRAKSKNSDYPMRGRDPK